MRGHAGVSQVDKQQGYDEDGIGLWGSVQSESLASVKGKAGGGMRGAGVDDDDVGVWGVAQEGSREAWVPPGGIDATNQERPPAVAQNLSNSRLSASPVSDGGSSGAGGGGRSTGGRGKDKGGKGGIGILRSTGIDMTSIGDKDVDPDEADMFLAKYADKKLPPSENGKPPSFLNRVFKF